MFAKVGWPRGGGTCEVCPSPVGSGAQPQNFFEFDICVG